MTRTVSQALHQFTRHYVGLWQEKTGLPPISHDLYGIPSPCIIRTGDECVYWEPAEFTTHKHLQPVEKALDIQLHPDISEFYTQQFAGDMQAVFEDIQLSLVQVWSEDDFIRLQENLIGHLVTQRRLKLPPTQFIATLESEFDMISVCNLNGEVILETFGTTKRRVLAADTASFLSQLTAVCTA
ncbi:SecY-interacting protein [Morganella morganii]|uniref:SecY-interacting protein n=1 Tax=Morganella morganii TaxID=582 RepID=UPI000BBD1E7E|nr:SecY-interacting protein [Morganella morganii]ATF54875.1 SecY-interacting protein [Morganella morganii]EGT3609245.1 SecY-interacting protein [Morganella morganii]MBT0334807.1 SecY-interacting protein [Morganella morganii subsp. morganii]MBT0513501.1 SecY-interacting protein [Morganella morganii subsp. morganii]MDN3815945.1 SecY-interacting protein [Morganella morganii]